MIPHSALPSFSFFLSRVIDNRQNYNIPPLDSHRLLSLVKNKPLTIAYLAFFFFPFWGPESHAVGSNRSSLPSLHGLNIESISMPS